MSSLPDEPVINDWCHTNLEVKTFTYKWTIQNFSWCSEPCGAFFQSSQFPADAANDKPKWSLTAYPRGYNPNYGNYLSLGILLHCTTKQYASVKLTVLSEIKENSRRAEKTFTHFLPNDSTSLICLNVPRDVLMSKANGFLSRDTLTIHCELAVVNEIVYISGRSSIVQTQDSKEKLCDDIASLLDNKKSCDVTLIAGGQELKAHKAILEARSEVFAAMFEHEMEEQKLNRVSIEDVDYNVLKEMLHYMYTAKSPNLNTMAEDLLAVADKYAINSLKEMCENSLQTNITIEKAANTLILADRHNVEELKSQTIDFIIGNAGSVMETQGWKELTATHSHLVLETFCSMAQKIKIN